MFTDFQDQEEERRNARKKKKNIYVYIRIRKEEREGSITGITSSFISFQTCTYPRNGFIQRHDVCCVQCTLRWWWCLFTVLLDERNRSPGARYYPWSIGVEGGWGGEKEEGGVSGGIHDQERWSVCTTSVVVALYGTTGAAAAAGTVVGFILKGRLDAAGTPMLRETGSATGDGTENSDQAQTLPSLYACSPPLSSTCPPSFHLLLLAAIASGEDGEREGEALVLPPSPLRRVPLLLPSSVAVPHSSSANPHQASLWPRSPPLSSLPFPLLLVSLRLVSSRLASPLLVPPRLAAPLDSFSVGRVVLSTDAAGIADIPALRSRSSMDAGRVPRVPVGRCR